MHKGLIAWFASNHVAANLLMLLIFAFGVASSFSIRNNSGGEGQFRGGHGVERALMFLESMTVSILSGHRVVPPYGMAGGLPGSPGRNRVVRADGHEEILPGCCRLEVAAGDTLIIETPGGGGFGSPAADSAD